MAEGLKTPPLTQQEFTGNDFEVAERIAKRLGYTQTAYTSTSALWGLFCLRDHARHRAGCIIKTKELGFLFVQDLEDLLIEEADLIPPPLLPSQQNTRLIERKIAAAARVKGYRGFDLEFEHGHWWLILKTGEAFDVVDAEGGNSVNGFDFESVGGGER